MHLHTGRRASATAIRGSAPSANSNSRPRPIRWALFAAAAVATGPAWSQEPYTTWRTYGGGGHSSQYSALDEINKTNVAQLTVAWSFPAGERS